VCANGCLFFGEILLRLQKDVETVIVNGVRSEWTLANNKNNALCDRVFGENKYKLTKAGVSQISAMIIIAETGGDMSAILFTNVTCPMGINTQT
jgi:hypothetical protein